MARVLISMPEELLIKINALAGDEGPTRADLIKEALKTYLQRNKSDNSAKMSNTISILESLLD